MSQPSPGARDAGFTLVEVLVSLALITTLMAALATFFVTATRLTHKQGVKQSATQLAQDGLEKARGLRGSALLSGRAKCAASCLDPAAIGAAGYLADTERWDAAAAGTTPPLLRRPGDTPEETRLNGITYRRYWYLGKCWQPGTGGTCDRDSTKPVALLRVVVAVTWPGQECAPKVCSHVTSALFSSELTDPIFSTNGG
jgi:prepilin-type N-terminal cleavage/methylation domain-containing protein